MDEETKDYIKSFTETLLNKFLTDEEAKVPAKNIYTLIKNMGGTWEGNYGLASNIGVFQHGTVKKIYNGEKQFSLFVPAPFKEGERARTLARHIGNLCLHLGYCTDKKCWENQTSQDWISFRKEGQIEQSTVFMLYLLMPEDEFWKIVDENTNEDNITDTLAVAKHFCVSRENVYDRGALSGIYWGEKCGY